MKLQWLYLVPPLALALVACGGGSGGGNSSAASTPADAITPPSASNLPRLFAGLVAASGSATDSTYLKACYFQAQKIGAKGQRGLDFLESLVIDKLDAPTAILYNAVTGAVAGKTNRAYKGTDGKVGAPPSLWTGVMSINADGTSNGFGAPCTPGEMVTLPKFTCYWLTDNLNGRVAALNYYDSIGDGRPETNTGSASLGNNGWGYGVAYYFWYEMGQGANCSAPDSSIIWRSLVRCTDIDKQACN